MDVRLLNVIMLGVAFHLIFFSFQTSVFVQQTVVNSIKTKPEYEFTGDGYISLCIIYSVFAISNWLSPSIISLSGSKYGMFLGAITYAVYTASFIYPTTILFYTAAALVGFGAGPLWTAQGGYLARNSDSKTSSRNAAIFWSMLQSSILFGNIFVYFAFDSQSIISDKTRYILYGALTIVAMIGITVILSLRNDSDCSDMNIVLGGPTKLTAWGQFCEAVKLIKSFKIILLSFAFLFTGVYLSFFTGIYGTAIGATSQFGADAKKYIGLSGILIGMGEIFGGSVFGLSGKLISQRISRDTIFVLGYLAAIGSIGLIYVNIPPDASLNKLSLQKPIIEPRISLAMIASMLLGFGDACFNTQIYSLLMSVYGDQSIGVFALFKFVQSIGSAIAFLYSTKLDLHYQLSIMAVIATIATVCFCLVEWKSRTNDETNIEKSESQQSIISKRHVQACQNGLGYGQVNKSTISGDESIPERLENHQKITID